MPRIEAKRTKDLDQFTKGRIYALRFDAEWGIHRIADHLEIPRGTVASFCTRSKNSDDVPKSKRAFCGRKRITSKQTDRQIARKSLADRFRTGVDIQKEISDTTQVSKRTVQRRLNEANICGRSPAKKTLLDKPHRTTRWAWAKSVRGWTFEQNWAQIAFSDESKYDLVSHRVQYVHRRPGERYAPQCINAQQNRSRGNVLVWGAFSASGATPLVRINGRLDSHAYVELLGANLLPALGTLLPNGGNFQQDNAPIHNSAYTRQFFLQNQIATINWPPLSPDMNPIENVWGRMEALLEKKKIQNSDALFQSLFEIWDRLMSDEEYRAGLIRSMPDRTLALKKARGGNTKY